MNGGSLELTGTRRILELGLVNFDLLLELFVYFNFFAKGFKVATGLAAIFDFLKFS